ncbi:hypothetical protein [Streptomyces virginiae]|uniref:hypothetical protein n=1 Tax=Streptomyces virginiae TaxID=1961 RepID=UPI00224CD61F|nr:hypothetical protein [Streptomyces virginiae]MCX5176748.1 hypothetical protein [Streptomyces virginiae]
MNDTASNGIPIVTGSDGQPYIGCDAAIALLRAIAEAQRTNADDPDIDVHVMSAAIDIEADALEVRAIAHTT